MSADYIVRTAKKELGISESPKRSNNVKYNTWYYGRKVRGSKYPWCMAFVMWVFHQAGMSKFLFNGKKTASCGLLYDWAKKNNIVFDEPEVGDLAIFSWSKYKVPQHVGIVESIGEEDIVTIEGNTSDDNDKDGGSVMERTRSKYLVCGYIRPKYDQVSNPDDVSIECSMPILKENDKCEYVGVLQMFLNKLGFDCGEIDCDFGKGTRLATKRFQTKNGCRCDGIVGGETWKKIFEEALDKLSIV